MTNDILPAHVRQAFLLKCKSAILMHYVGDRFQIWDDWADKGSQGFIYLHSGSFTRDARKGLRELRKLVKAGHLTEEERVSHNEMCRFKLVDKNLERSLLINAYSHWLRVGYNTHQIIERRH